MNRILSCLFLIVFFSHCNTPPKEETKTSPDIFGWNEQNIADLKNECLDRYGKDQKGKKQTQKEDYCNCLVEKIIYSIKFEQHQAPNEATVTLYEEFSNACTELTKE